METSRQLPRLSDFTPLCDFQSQTPTSFHSGPPVLYHHTPRATLKFSSLEAASSTAFSSFTNTQSSAPETHAPTNGTNGSSAPSGVENDAEEEENEFQTNDEVEINEVGVWVTSTHFILTHHSTPPTAAVPSVLKIPYPCISLHARSSPPPALYLQLLSTAAPIYDDHDPSNTIASTIIPSPSSPSQENEAADLYTALSACADLHPDPTADGDDDDDAFWNGEDDRIDESGVGYLAHRVYGSGDHGDEGALSGATALPPPMPGSGGWITAENVGEFFDDAGEMREGVGGRLGEGAGRVRGRDDEEEGEERRGHAAVNGDGGVGEGGDETKWRRTG